MSDAMNCRLKGSILEADRCLQCFDAPCAKGCPAGVEVDKFIRLLSKGDIAGAAAVVEKDNPLGWVCGYICPFETLCQKNCTSKKLGKGIDIRTLQQYVIQEARLLGEANQSAIREEIPEQRVNVDGKIQIVEPEGKGEGKVAVVGAGPGGLACAVYLKQLGYEVEIFEATDKVGGRLTQGIPDFRMDQDVVKEQLDDAVKGVKVNLNSELGRDFSIQSLKDQGFRAIFLATGKWRENMLPLPGADLDGIYSPADILYKNEWRNKGHKVAGVIGYGNVAMDVVRTLKRGGVDEVNVFFVGSNPEVTAWADEREDVFQEGGIVHMLASPKEIFGKDGKVSGMKLSRTVVTYNENGSWNFIPQGEELEYNYPLDMVVISIGFGTFRNMLEEQGFELDRPGHLVVGDDLQTSIPGVFAGGDAVFGRGAAVQAIGDGKRAALNIHEYLKKEGK